ncbi:MAG TPA: DNA helicase RecQ [Lunatimonas sp.]|nr:DNA helicase RecQ [Lunatimonas sp.]
MKPIDILKDFYGYDQFRGNQEPIINAVMAGKDTIALMPTGAGKSVCYQVPAMLLPGLTLVVSPLIALMKDQVDALNAIGIPAAFLNSTQSSSEQRFISQEVTSGKIKLLYVAPERIFSGGNSVLDLLGNVTLSLVAVDEAHCVSQWGHDFRPEYLKIGELRKKFKDIPFLALTATADTLTRKDIADKLGLVSPNWFVSSFDRPNITYRVVLRNDAFQKLIDFLSHHPGDSGIIYCLSRKGVEDTAERLQEYGYHALPYHAGLERDVRQRNQEQFIKDETKIIVATIAFGMGIDKSNVRFVVHMNMPQNVESYYQETGRAGRDGLPSEVLLFYSFGDSITLGRMIESSENPDHIEVMKKKLDRMVSFCQTQRCRRRFLLDYFGETQKEDCGNCDICFQKGNKIDVTIFSQMMLSAVVRLKRPFGLGYVILVLRGSKSAKVQEAHMALGVYGVGKDKTEQFWKKLGNQLVLEGYLEADKDYSTLSLTPLAWEKLKQKEKIMLSMDEGILATPTEQSHDKGLLEKLKNLRFSLARKFNVPPYIIFSDATLVEMATHYPTDLATLRQINGVGQVKAEKYGDEFRRVIGHYMVENDITPPAPNRIGGSQRRPSSSLKNSGSEKETLEMFQKGLSVDQIAEKREMAPSTIESHLFNLTEKKLIPQHKFLNNDQIAEIKAFYATQDGHFLRPLKDHFGDKYSYLQLKVAVRIS